MADELSSAGGLRCSVASPILVDALNVAFWCGAPPSLRLPLAMLAASGLRGRPVVLCFDASTQYRLPAAERELYAELRRWVPGCVEVPAGSPADSWLLRRARDSGGSIVSRDRFRGHRRGFRRIVHDPNRLCDGWVENGRLRVPALGLSLPLAVPVVTR